jgi:hypothetical protein
VPEFPFNCSLELSRELLSRTSDVLTRQQLESHINDLGNRMRGEPLRVEARLVSPQGTQNLAIVGGSTTELSVPDGGTVMEPACASGSAARWSIFLT